MTLPCRKASVRSSAAQWNVDALVRAGSGDLLPCFFSVLPTGCTFQTVSSEEGEKLLDSVRTALGPTASVPQVVKGGACGGEDEDGEFPFVGAMLSVTWDFPREARDSFVVKVKELLGACEASA
ncbi:MAG: hypothetical protein HY896_13895 [Deltaproteobacteria bacterium]|nr:hypothetical protein [Deltaproteobacteria bacterium]